MAGLLLSIILMCFFHEIQGQALPPPKLIVNPLTITETDSVTLNCQTPSSVSVSQCHFYTGNNETFETSCRRTLTGTELLKISRQRSPSEVQVACFYREYVFSSSYSHIFFITIETLRPPNLTVNPPVITETDSVTLSCQTPSSSSVTGCYIFTATQRLSEGVCVQTLKFSELLKMVQRLPAEVEVRCFYNVKSGDSSSHSDPSTITMKTLQSLKPDMSLQSFEGEHIFFICSLPGSVKRGTECNLYFGEVNRPILATTTMQKTSKTKQWFCSFTVPFDDLLRYLDSVQQKDASCDYKLEREQNSLSPRSDRRSLTGSLPANLSPTSTVKSTVRTMIKPMPGGNDADVVGRESSTMRKNSTFNVTAAGSDVTMSSVSTPAISVNKTSGSPPANPSPTSTVTSTVKATVTPRGNDAAGSSVITSNVSTTATSVNLIPTATVIKVFISVAGFGASVAIVFLVLVLRGRLKRRTERSFSDTKANITDDSVCLTNINHGEVELPDNNVYSLITSVPGADCSTGFEKLSREEARSQHSDIYHLYDTIPELPPASDQPDMLYSLLQAH